MSLVGFWLFSPPDSYAKATKNCIYAVVLWPQFMPRGAKLARVRVWLRETRASLSERLKSVIGFVQLLKTVLFLCSRITSRKLTWNLFAQCCHIQPLFHHFRCVCVCLYFATCFRNERSIHLACWVVEFACLSQTRVLWQLFYTGSCRLQSSKWIRTTVTHRCKVRTTLFANMKLAFCSQC